jgi:uncharacterized protein (DUF736 family)
MATVGTFIAKDGKLTGRIQTLTLNTALTFLPNEGQSRQEAPAYRVFAGKTEAGAAWEKTSKAGVTYHSVKLDDPTFAAPIYASLFEQEDGSFALVWSRPTRD